MASGGRWVLTRGVAALEPEQVAAILQQVMTFNTFTTSNDPHGEHDFGRLELEDDLQVFWKIDYYEDSTLTYGAEAPALKCYRVLTIMRTDEY